ELAARAEVTVCDYNYAFDPYVSLPDFSPDQDLSDAVLVIDEVHNLVERGRGYYSPELSAGAARQAAAAFGHLGEPIYRRLSALCLKLAAIVEDAVHDCLDDLAGGSGGGAGLEPAGEDGGAGQGRDRAAEAPLPEELFWRLRAELDASFVDYLEHQRDHRSFRAEDPFVELYFDFLRFLNGVAAADAAFSQFVEICRGDCRGRVLCKDPSRFLGEVINRAHAAIGLSATLSPPEFYTGLLGVAAGRTAFVEIPNLL